MSADALSTRPGRAHTRPGPKARAGIRPAASAAWFALAAALFCAACVQAAGSGSQRLLRVSLEGASEQPISGRLLVFATQAERAQAEAGEGEVQAVDVNPFMPTAVAVAGREVVHLAPGASVHVDLDDQAFPSAFADLPAGDYLLQAVLDTNHDYPYLGRSGGDLVSEVVAVALGGGADLPAVRLVTQLPVSDDPWHLSARASQSMRDALPGARANTIDASMVSPSLSAFFGRPVSIRARVLTPPGYTDDAQTRYPTVYYTHGFSGGFNRFASTIVRAWRGMAAGEYPPMIWVFMDMSWATGTHQFADSVNNGPWGTALTRELIPSLEARFRMDGNAQGRLLTGHSSGGWATLWLQVRHPTLFGGTWSTAPDPADFRDFTGVDLYAHGANLYRRADGSAIGLVRDQGKILATIEDFARMERVLGAHGGQMASFEWVFSPRGADGRPQPLFDRDTGVVDAAVAAHWRGHFDIAERLRTRWPTLQPDLDGKIRVIVGTADNFHLDGSVRRLQAVLDGLGARSDFRYLDGRTHFDLYREGDDNHALLKTIAWEMYAVARPEAAPAPVP
jgi:hypothetical protein